MSGCRNHLPACNTGPSQELKHHGGLEPLDVGHCNSTADDTSCHTPIVFSQTWPSGGNTATIAASATRSITSTPLAKDASAATSCLHHLRQVRPAEQSGNPAAHHDEAPAHHDEAAEHCDEARDPFEGAQQDGSSGDPGSLDASRNTEGAPSSGAPGSQGEGGARHGAKRGRALEACPSMQEESSSGACAGDSPRKARRRKHVLVVEENNNDDEEQFLQVRAAIRSMEKRRSTTGDLPNVSMEAFLDSLQEEEDMRLEDSVVGNDLLLDKCRCQAKRLRGILGVLATPTGLHATFPANFLGHVVQAVIPTAHLVSLAGPTVQALKPFQLASINYFAMLLHREFSGCVLADSSRLGKHAQVAVWLSALRGIGDRLTPAAPTKSAIKPANRSKRSHKPCCMLAIVVAVETRLEHWQAQLQKWAPSLRVANFSSCSVARQILHEHSHTVARIGAASSTLASAPYDVVLAPYSLYSSHISDASDSVIKDRTALEALSWRCAVLDSVADVPRATFTHLRDLLLATHFRVSVLHSPPTAALATWQLRNVVETTMPEVFDDGHADPASLAPAPEATEQQEKEAMCAALMPYTMTRTPVMVARQLPARRQIVGCVSMFPRQNALYQQCRTHYMTSAPSQTPGVSSDGCTATGTSNCAQTAPSTQPAEEAWAREAFRWLHSTAQHPLLVRSVYTGRRLDAVVRASMRARIFGECSTEEATRQRLCSLSDIAIHKLCHSQPALEQFSLTVKELMASPKCGSLVQLLHRLAKGQHQVVIASQFTEVLDICQSLLYHLQLSHLRLDEFTPMPSRAALAATFRNNKARILLLQSCVVAKGEPLDLSSADTCVLHDITLDPAVDRAVEACCLTLGQNSTTTIQRFITRGSVEEALHQYHQACFRHDAVAQSKPSDAAIAHAIMASELRAFSSSPGAVSAEAAPPDGRGHRGSCSFDSSVACVER